MNKEKAEATMNKLGSIKEPFLFIIDFEMKNNDIIPLKDLNKNSIEYSIHSTSNTPPKKEDFSFSKFPILKSTYETSFNTVHEQISYGNSYLTNLTAETKIETNLSLQQIYEYSKAPYKLLYQNKFVVFSPETFVKIKDGKISSFPMKGTIEANIPNAEDKILNNKKEAAEHATITDLIRNDLSTVATNVKVEKYRYIDRIKTNNGELLQVSSIISGDLQKNYSNEIGTILFKLLPAGSISGAPKQKTLDIISKAENYKRGFYTGVFGIFDGVNLDSGVMIRFIEKQDHKLVFKSGGGITINSNLEEEYKELINKVYLPFETN